jgi:hypothetical protein
MRRTVLRSAAHPEPRRCVAEARVEGLARIANRIVNEVPAVNRVVGACPPQAEHHQQAAGDNRMGIRRLPSFSSEAL